MIVDENLNDCSNEIITDLKSENTKLKRNLGICIGITIISVFLVVYTMFVCSRQDKLLHKLNMQLEQEEQILSLEYSIGYWFINQPEQINDSILYAFLKDNNAWYPEILLKQAKLESGNYTSNVYNNSNNLYGMKKVGKRQTTQLNNTYNGYGCYTNWCLSVLDRLLWDYYHFDKKPTKEEYFTKLQCFAEDINYIDKLK